MKIGEYELDPPLINGGGVVKTPNETIRMAATGVGAVLGGSFTLNGRLGHNPNGERVYYHDPDTGITYNSYDLRNPGTLLLSEFLPDMIQISHDAGKPFILNLAPVSDDPVDEISTMFEFLRHSKLEDLDEKLDAVELNASCPSLINKVGHRRELLSQRFQLLGETLLRLNDIKANVVPFGTTIVRVSPFTHQSDALKLAKVLKESGTQAVTAFNTFHGGRPLDAHGHQILQVPGGVGGQSGRGMSAKAEAQTAWLVDARAEVKGNFDIIGSNGIYDGLSMKRRLDIGVQAVSASTLFFEAQFAGQSWESAVKELLREYDELI